MACRSKPGRKWGCTFALEQLQPPQTPQCTGTELELKQFRFAYPHGSAILHIQDCTIPAGRIVGIIGNNGGWQVHLFTVLLRAGEAMRRGNLERQAIPFERSAEHLLYGHAGGKPSALYRNSPGRSVDQHGGAGYKTSRGNPDPAGSPPIQRQAPHVAFQRAETEGGHRIRHCVKAVYSLFDEPTSGLDYRHMKEVAAVLRQLSTGRRHCLCDHTRSGTAAGLLHGHHPFRPGKHCRPISYGCGRPFKGLRLFYGKRRLKCGQLLCAPVLQRGHAELLLEYRCKLSLIGIANLLRDFRNGAAGVR